MYSNIYIKFIANIFLNFILFIFNHKIINTQSSKNIFTLQLLVDYYYF